MEMLILGSKSILEKALADVPAGLLPEGITGGETKLVWTSANADEVESARRTFDFLRNKGYAAFKAVGERGERGEQVFAFDPQAERLILAPQMRGGV